MAETLEWPGKSGTKYRYYTLSSLEASKIKASPGNYIFAKRSDAGGMIPIYIGKTEDLSARLSNHEKWASAKRHGATHVYAHTSTGTEQSRLNEEQDLIARWNPPLNVHHRTVG